MRPKDLEPLLTHRKYVAHSLRHHVEWQRSRRLTQRIQTFLWKINVIGMQPKIQALWCALMTFSRLISKCVEMANGKFSTKWTSDGWPSYSHWIILGNTSLMLSLKIPTWYPSISKAGPIELMMMTTPHGWKEIINLSIILAKYDCRINDICSLNIFAKWYLRQNNRCFITLPNRIERVDAWGKFENNDFRYYWINLMKQSILNDVTALQFHWYAFYWLIQILQKQ